jgi:hypothetical protein
LELDRELAHLVPQVQHDADLANEVSLALLK